MGLIARSSTDFLLYFLRAYPGRTILMTALLFLGGLAEGVGLLTLLPLLDLAVGTDAAAQSEMSQRIAGLLQIAGIAPTLGTLILLLVIAMCLKGFMVWLAMRQVGYTVAQVAMDLRLRLMRALMEAEWSYFSRYPTGHFTNAISTEAHRATLSYRMGCAALAGVVQVVIYSAVVFVVSWRVAVAGLVIGTLVVIALRRFIRVGRAAGLAQTEVMKSLVARLTDAVPGIKPIKAMAREHHLLPLLEQETDGYRLAQQRQVLAAETLHAWREPILVVIIGVGLYGLITQGNQPMSSILILAVLFYRLLQTMNNVQAMYQDMTHGESALHSIREHTERAEHAREVTSGTEFPPPLLEGIRLDRVTFRYGERAILDDVTVDFPVGKFIAITGPSGAGKTTLVDLAIGLLRPDAGAVLVDGVDLARLDAKAWRRMLGYVPQEILLFHGTVFHNVTLGDNSIERSRVEAALRASGAWDFVSALRDGMDQVVGERGSKLSGGQRQRIAIARALLGRPKVLILDEGTAALDPATEAEIKATLRRLTPEVTVIAISHQPALSEVADLVYEVANGGVVRVGGTETAGWTGGEREEPGLRPLGRTL
jgi:ATP-binding cassette subfamily C protein